MNYLGIKCHIHDKGTVILLFIFTGLPLFLTPLSSNAGPASTLYGETISLDQAIRLALANNPSLKAVEERLHQYEQQLKLAKAPYWPQIGTGLTAIRNNLSQNQKATLAAMQPVENPQKNFKASLGANWVLFDGFARKHGTQAARIGIERGAAQEGGAISRLASQVATAYFQAQLAREKREVIEADKAFQKRLLKDAKARYEFGEGTYGDMLNFEAGLNSADAAYIAAKADYENSLTLLAALLALPGKKVRTKMEPRFLDTPQDQEVLSGNQNKLLNAAIDQRPEIQDAKLAVAQARENFNMAKASLYPKAILFASIDGQRVDSLHFERDDCGNTVGIEFSYEIFTGGARNAKIETARSQLAEAEYHLARARLEVRSEVETAVTQVQSADQQLKLQMKNAHLVREIRDLVENEYSAGQTDLARLNQAQRDLIAASGQMALARVTLTQALFNLDVATGQVLEKYNKNAPEQPVAE